MALDSSFWIDADETPHGLCSVLSKLPGLSPSSDGRSNRLLGDGIAITASAPAFDDGMVSGFGIDPHLRLWFSCLDKARSAQWTLHTVHVVVHILKTFPEADALLLYSSDTPALLRRSGRLVLFRTAGLWAAGVEPSVLRLMELEYDWADFDGDC